MISDFSTYMNISYLSLGFIYKFQLSNLNPNSYLQFLQDQPEIILSESSYYFVCLFFLGLAFMGSK